MGNVLCPQRAAPLHKNVNGFMHMRPLADPGHATSGALITDVVEVLHNRVFFAINAKLPKMVMLSTKPFTTAKKLPSVGLDVVITTTKS